MSPCALARDHARDLRRISGTIAAEEYTAKTGRSPKLQWGLMHDLPEVAKAAFPQAGRPTRPSLSRAAGPSPTSVRRESRIKKAVLAIAGRRR